MDALLPYFKGYGMRSILVEVAKGFEKLKISSTSFALNIIFNPDTEAVHKLRNAVFVLLLVTPVCMPIVTLLNNPLLTTAHASPPSNIQTNGKKFKNTSFPPC